MWTNDGPSRFVIAKDISANLILLLPRAEVVGDERDVVHHPSEIDYFFITSNRRDGFFHYRNSMQPTLSPIVNPNHPYPAVPHLILTSEYPDACLWVEYELDYILHLSLCMPQRILHSYAIYRVYLPQNIRMHASQLGQLGQSALAISDRRHGEEVGRRTTRAEMNVWNGAVRILLLLLYSPLDNMRLGRNGATSGISGSGVLLWRKDEEIS